ncbi:S1 family peptidase [Actinokineospora inagensis]|uniref:S1 family peptidase n=1 Tax=Actinokineospora inagensis TaxID=103730 RepID=UPI00040D6D72|nr:serine protease [Actinokineospora inagensis]
MRKFMRALAVGIALVLVGVGGMARATEDPGRVVGGVRAPQGIYPWLARLSMGCGGSLVAPSVVLTAAHCVAGTGPETRIQALFGTVDLASTDATVVNSASVYRAPDYTTAGKGNDWALIKLARPLSFPVVKLEPSVVGAGPFRVMGWGATQEGGEQQRYLLHANVPYVDDTTCGKLYTKFGYSFVPAAMLCAGVVGTGGIDTCQGDSGGPMVAVDTAGAWRQVGIVSWGVGCARPQFPGVYTEIADYYQSIQSAITALS